MHWSPDLVALVRSSLEDVFGVSPQNCLCTILEQHNA